MRLPPGVVFTTLHFLRTKNARVFGSGHLFLLVKCNTLAYWTELSVKT